MKLIIGNRNYSSWSFRPWIALKAKHIDFEEEVIPFDFEGGNKAIKAASPTGRVPVLVDGEIVIPESLAILEYLAETFPHKGFWPADRKARAQARAISSEMHAGFSALRNAAPMNIRRKPAGIEVTPAVASDVARIEEIWHGCLKAWGGPFLFGEFSNADAMFAPVVNRLEAYELSQHLAVRAYTQAMKSHPAWNAWEKLALAEPWVVAEDEV